MKRVYKVVSELSPYIPYVIKEAVRSRFSVKSYDYARSRELNSFFDKNEAFFSDSPYCLAIIDDPSQYHQHYVAACLEMRISFKVIDLLADDWVERFFSCRCDAVLVWPDCSTTVIKQVYDYRLHILERDLGFSIYPSWHECWLTEHKPRLRDWLDAHEIPHPKTWVFYDKSQAIDFVRSASFPIVCKTATGAGGAGVVVIQGRSELVDIINMSFGKGLRPRRHDVFDRQQGFIFLQEYLPDVEEWRMVRIGDSYFGYRKEKGRDGLHSASHKWSWLDPGVELLDLLKRVTDIGMFTSMDVDVFRTNDGKLLVNELQTVFGCTTPAIYMKVNNIEGRYLYSEDGWKFEAGIYWRNHMCNLRVEYLLQRLGEKIRS